MEYLLSTECTNKMIAIESIATGMRAINPADAILFAPGVLKSSVYVLNNYGRALFKCILRKSDLPITGLVLPTTFKAHEGEWL